MFLTRYTALCFVFQGRVSIISMKTIKQEIKRTKDDDGVTLAEAKVF